MSQNITEYALVSNSNADYKFSEVMSQNIRTFANIKLLFYHRDMETMIHANQRQSRNCAPALNLFLHFYNPKRTLFRDNFNLSLGKLSITLPRHDWHALNKKVLPVYLVDFFSISTEIDKKFKYESSARDICLRRKIFAKNPRSKCDIIKLNF